MKLTHDRPAQAGWYWAKPKGSNCIRMVAVGGEHPFLTINGAYNEIGDKDTKIAYVWNIELWSERLTHEANP